MPAQRTLAPLAPVTGARPAGSPSRDVLSALTEALEAFTVVDLSTDIADHDSGPFGTRMEVLEADAGARFLVEQVVPRMAPELAGRLRAESFSGGRFLRHELVTASTHAGSHVDAPGHYGGALGEGSFVNDAPLELFFGPGICLDGSGGAGSVVTREDLEASGRLAGEARLDGTIVVIRAGASRGIAVAVVERLLERGVRVIGTDATSFDGPFADMLETQAQTGDGSVAWPCHVLGRERPYYQLEGLANLDQLPARGFFVWATPVKVRGATAAWVRALALVPASAMAGRR
jgi:cyclase